MIKIENVETYGWEAAIRGMRNPMNSWEKSDTLYENVCGDDGKAHTSGFYILGENDLKLMKALFKAGSDHRKFMRMITVSCDITAPLYWWKEFDTYKVGTVANSCSTMHKIQAKEFTLDDFSHEHLINDDDEDLYDSLGETVADIDGSLCNIHSSDLLCLTIRLLNAYRDKFLETKDKKYWWQMIQLLPSSYNQKRTVVMNYEVLANMNRTGRRKDHKLDEWQDFCFIVDKLPYYKDICE